MLSADAALVVLVACAGVLGLSIGALVGWILRDRRDRRPYASGFRDGQKVLTDMPDWERELLIKDQPTP